MRFPIYRKITLFFSVIIFAVPVCLANNELYKQARTLHRNGQFDEAIGAYKSYLSRPVEEDSDLAMYTDALVQLMNTFQSIGDPEGCISALQEVFESSPTLQNEYLRDFYSVMGYALSRTEKMKLAEDTTLKALTLPLHNATPERYFRDYAYAAAVFYSNPDYQNEVINWCQEALVQAKSCMNTSGQQWVMSMLGSLYKRTGNLNGALELFQRSIEESRSREDNLGVLNSLSSLIDLFLYWNIPEYADMYASEAVQLEKHISDKNPMVSSQIYINKGRALHHLGLTDSIPFYIEHARELCETLPYNSGMVDINLLNGIYLTEKDGDSLNLGIQELQKVIRQGTASNRAKAYHQLAQTYLKNGQDKEAEVALDSLYLILNQTDLPAQLLHIEYKPIIDYYLETSNQVKVEEYTKMMFQEQKAFKEKSLNYNLVETIVDLQTGSRLQQLKISQLKQANHRLWLLICIGLSVMAMTIVVTQLIYQRKRHIRQIRNADEQLASLVEKLNQANDEKDKISQEVKEFLSEKDNRQEIETLTPYVLKESGEIKFRQCFYSLKISHFI
jgi:tetratricopeptide (TPR) repeat protein